MNAQERSNKLQALAEKNGVPQSAVDFLLYTQTPIDQAEKIIKGAAAGCSWNRAFKKAEVR